VTGGEPGEQQHLGTALGDIEQAMPRFARWMYATVKPALGNRVVDAGAGIGTYAEMLLADGHEVVALEYDATFASRLKDRFAGNPKVSVFQSDLCNPDGLPEFAPVDSMLCLNVLEHVPDDALALKNMRERVKPGGSLALLVPAGPRLLNSMDRAIGHYRRYSKSELERKLKATGWVVERSFRFNAFGIPGWFVAGLLGRKTPGRTLSSLYDALTPGFAVAERYAIRGLVGLSLVAICCRKE
jgi:SAM-dependent methyltransferase